MLSGYSVRLNWSEEDNAYIATSPEFPGLSGVHANAEVALAELREALEMAVEVLQEDGEALPERRAFVAHSGKFVLRLPRSMHAELTRRAEEEDVSLNAYVVTLVARGLGDTVARAEAEQALAGLLQHLRSEMANSISVSARDVAANAPPIPPQFSQFAPATDPFSNLAIARGD